MEIVNFWIFGMMYDASDALALPKETVKVVAHSHLDTCRIFGVRNYRLVTPQEVTVQNRERMAGMTWQDAQAYLKKCIEYYVLGQHSGPY